MYHWVLYLKSTLADNSSAKRAACKLIAEKEKYMQSQIGTKLRRKWLIIGLLEVLPVIAGYTLSQVMESVIFKFDYLITGIVVSSIIINHFRNKTPLPPIHIQKNNLIPITD